MKQSFKRGFGVLEILLLSAGIIILIVLAMIFLSPTRKEPEARNSKRFVDLNTIANGIYEYAFRNGGRLPENIGDQFQEICAGSNCSAGFIDLSGLKQDNKYLIEIPKDPNVAGAGSGYKIKRDGDKIIIIAPNAELGEKIEIKR